MFKSLKVIKIEGYFFYLRHRTSNASTTTHTAAYIFRLV